MVPTSTISPPMIMTVSAVYTSLAKALIFPFRTGPIFRDDCLARANMIFKGDPARRDIRVGSPKLDPLQQEPDQRHVQAYRCRGRRIPWQCHRLRMLQVIPGILRQLTFLPSGDPHGLEWWCPEVCRSRDSNSEG